MIQNAGLVIWEELEEADRSWERMRRVNVDAPFHITRAAFPVMKDQGLRAVRLHDVGAARWPSSAPGPGSPPTRSGRWRTSGS